MTTLFISDLHLDAERPDGIARFLRFIETEAREASALYILGDLFEVWIGDDDTNPSGAAQPASSSGAAQPAHDDEASPKFTSLGEVGAWLETLSDVEGNVELRRIQEAVSVLKNPTKISVFCICGPWQ